MAIAPEMRGSRIEGHIPKGIGSRYDANFQLRMIRCAESKLQRSRLEEM